MSAVEKDSEDGFETVQFSTEDCRRWAKEIHDSLHLMKDKSPDAYKMAAASALALETFADRLESTGEDEAVFTNAPQPPRGELN